MKLNKINNLSKKEVVAIIAYLQRLGSDIHKAPVEKIENGENN